MLAHLEAEGQEMVTVVVTEHSALDCSLSFVSAGKKKEDFIVSMA